MVVARAGAGVEVVGDAQAGEVLGDQAKEALESRIALRRLGTVDDVAWSVVFLASEQAGYITGTVMNVSGGLYM